MAKFNKYDFVKFTKEAREDFNLPCDTMLVTNIFQDVDGTVSYALISWFDFGIYTMQKEEWLEGEQSPIPTMTLLPTSGLVALDLYDHALHESKKTVYILGTAYTIETRKVSEDEYMKQKHLCGYCCEESKRIVVADMSEKEYFELDEAEQKSCYKRTLRHELLHAFLNESGLSDDASTPSGSWAKHEEMVDWFAIQSPKIFKTFEELDIL